MVPRLRVSALAYARRSVSVFHCEPGGKRPLTVRLRWPDRSGASASQPLPCNSSTASA
jgi:hypothetical protein